MSRRVALLVVTVGVLLWASANAQLDFLNRGLGLSSLDVDPSLCPTKSAFREADPPLTFDARDRWPDCVFGIVDQGSCGSCWAVSTSQVLSDRFCIQTNATVRRLLSAQHQVNCDHSCKSMGTSCNSGCDGGYMDQAFIYLGEEGTVGESCKSYVGEDETCSDFVCDSGQSTATTFYAKGCNKISSVENMMKEIYLNGPIVAAFTVYQDFYEYDGGVYDTQSGMEKGGHAIRVLGWGVESGKPYWLCANSWGENWGENGYFKILRGSDHCGIESYAVTSYPDLDRINYDSSDLQDEDEPSDNDDDGNGDGHSESGGDDSDAASLLLPFSVNKII